MWKCGTKGQSPKWIALLFFAWWPPAVGAGFIRWLTPPIALFTVVAAGFSPRKRSLRGYGELVSRSIP